jgi:hypothetical protein
MKHLNQFTLLRALPWRTRVAAVVAALSQIKDGRHALPARLFRRKICVYPSALSACDAHLEDIFTAVGDPCPLRVATSADVTSGAIPAHRYLLTRKVMHTFYYTLLLEVKEFRSVGAKQHLPAVLKTGWCSSLATPAE